MSPARSRPRANPTTLTLGELIPAQGRRHRGHLAPGQRFPSGMRPSRRRAQGVDLDSIGPYVIGDDLRFMDWRATARTGRAQMKRFVAESHLARILVVDFRPPMRFATNTHPMAKTAALAAARLAWEAFHIHEPIGLSVVPERETIEPRRGRGQVIRVLDHLVARYATMGADDQDPAMSDSGALAAAVDRAAASLHKGDEITVISDFGGPLDALKSIARQLAGSRTIRAVIVEDPIYDSPLSAGRYPIRVASDDARASAVVPRSGVSRQHGVAESLRADLRRSLRQSGIHIVEITAATLLSEGNGR